MKKYKEAEIKHNKTKIKILHCLFEFQSRGGPIPINNIRNKKIFSKYKILIKKLEKKHIYFEGRLATYRYLNMDEVIECALILFSKLKKKYKFK